MTVQRHTNPFPIKWEDPGPRTRKASTGKTKRFIAALSTRPGRWAIYREGAKDTSQLSDLRKRYPEAEWAHRRQPDGKYTFYGRYREVLPVTTNGTQP